MKYQHFGRPASLHIGPQKLTLVDRHNAISTCCTSVESPYWNSKANFVDGLNALISTPVALGGKWRNFYPGSIRNLSGIFLVLDAVGGGKASRALLIDSCKESRSLAGWRRGSESVFDQQLQGKSISGKLAERLRECF